MIVLKQSDSKINSNLYDLRRENKFQKVPTFPELSSALSVRHLVNPENSHMPLIRLLFLAVFSFCGFLQAEESQPDHPIRLACVGDSITQGAGLKDPGKEAYPARLQAMLGAAWEVRNFGVSGRTLQHAGDYPIWKEKAFQNAIDFAPDVVSIKLGTNDSKPQNWNAQRYEADAKEMVETFQKLPSHPRVILCLPVPVFKAEQWGINAKIVEDQVIPALRRVARATGAEILDLHRPSLGDAKFYPDTVHPNAEGSNHIAQLFANYLQRPADPAFHVAAKIPAGAKEGDFHGYKSWEFQLAGRKAIVVEPKRADSMHSWAWRLEFFGHEPQVDLGLLEQGFHLLFIDTFGMCGGKTAEPIWDALYTFSQGAGLDKRAVLIGLSRGGLCAYNRALARPETVAAIYADAPVLDLRSWPSLKRKNEIEEAFVAYGLNEETLKTWKGPLDRLDILAKAGIPLIHVVGDADKVVPVAENTAIVEERYPKLGGRIEVIHKPGVDHHPHSLPDPTPIVKFLLEASRPSALGLSCGKVMILGDSITQNGAWVSYLSYLLQKQYPQANFDLISVGLSSETTSGLSEPGHAGGAFPRPCVHERLQRALTAVKPAQVLACYGMNDGIYLPLEESRFAAFRSGMTRLVSECRAAGAWVMLATPPVYDGGAKGYQDLLSAYSRWELLTPPAGTTAVCDIHFQMNTALLERRAANSKFRFAGDGIHPDALGHLIMARGVLSGLGLNFAESPEQQLAAIEADPLFKLIDQHRQKRSAAWLASIGYNREKKVAHGTGDIAAIEKSLAEQQKLIDEMRRKK